VRLEKEKEGGFPFIPAADEVFLKKFLNLRSPWKSRKYKGLGRESSFLFIA
jgi:hypothetical protein